MQGKQTVRPTITLSRTSLAMLLNTKNKEVTQALRQKDVPH